MVLSKRRAVTALVGGVFVITTVFVTLAVRWANHPTGESASTNVHLAYADTYEAAWRQDTEGGEALVTGTLFIPRLQELLAQDTERTSVNEQIFQKIKDLNESEVPIVVTIDSPSTSTVAALPDATIQASLGLSSPDATFAVTGFYPLVPPTQVSADGISTSRRMWVAIFTSSEDWSWATIRDVKLEIKDIGQKKPRTLTWSQPATLSQD